MRVRTKLVRNLTPAEYRACIRLTLHKKGHGGMRDWLAWLRRHHWLPHQGRVFMLEDGDGLQAWALYYVTAPENRDPGPHVHVYVRSTLQGHGLGSQLLRAVLRHDPQVQGSAYSQESRAFYMRHGMRYLTGPRSVARPQSRQPCSLHVYGPKDNFCANCGEPW